MKGDDYMKGRHFWTHFVCGLVVGGIVGARIFWSVFDSSIVFVGCTFVFAVIFALAVGYWGDPLWRNLLDRWAWWR
jgi:hypothetical protein